MKVLGKYGAISPSPTAGDVGPVLFLRRAWNRVTSMLPRKGSTTGEALRGQIGGRPAGPTQLIAQPSGQGLAAETDLCSLSSDHAQWQPGDVHPTHLSSTQTRSGHLRASPTVHVKRDSRPRPWVSCSGDLETAQVLLPLRPCPRSLPRLALMPPGALEVWRPTRSFRMSSGL